MTIFARGRRIGVFALQLKSRSSILVAVLVALLAFPAAARGGESATHYYVSLGDSLSVGVQPIGAPPFHQTNEGYTDQLYAMLQAEEPKLKHIRLGCGGESTTSMLEGSQFPWVASSCGPPGFYLHQYPHKTQLAEAVAFLHAHRGFVRLVTIDIGANDILGPGGAAEIVQNLPVILAELRAAAPRVPIVGMSYYDAFLPAAWAAGGLPALQNEVASIVAFNNLLEGIYGGAGVAVADVESAFQTTDFTVVDGTPLNVRRICQWTWFCALGNIHANATGYGVIAQAFASIVLAP